MRLRIFLGLVTMFTAAGSILNASSASAYQLMEPAASVSAPVATAVTTTVASATTSDVPCPSTVDGSLPRLGADLTAGLAAYARNPSGGSSESWIDSGGAYGGGVPASAVRTLMRRGLAAGLTEVQVASFLQPGFLRGMNDPRGGAWLFDFIGRQNDPAFLAQLAAYAGALNGRYVSPMSAQADVFEAIPMLRAAYMAQAGAIPPDMTTAEPMLSLANQGYAPAQRTIQAFLAAGNHPSAGAQDAGGVADLMRASVYDYFVATYAGPLTPDAAAALANRGAYNAWVERIADWEQGGALMDQAPNPATFPAPVTSSTTSSSTTAVTEEVPAATC